MTTTVDPAMVQKRLGDDVVVLDARARRPHADPVVLEQTLLALDVNDATGPHPVQAPAPIVAAE